MLPPVQRIYYFDNLRALAMLAGVYLHAAFAYAEPAQEIWLATDAGSSVFVDGTIWFIHLFRMSLFFLLSGYFAALVIARKGYKAFLSGRFLRIAVPFVVFYPILLVAATATIVFALQYLDHPRGLMKLIADASATRTGQAERQSLTTMHLWFLYYLMIFGLATPLLYQLPIWERLTPRHWIIAICWMPLALVPGVLGAGAPLPAPESFWPVWWPFAFYGLFYVAGWALFGRESALTSLLGYERHLLVGSAALFVPYYLCLPRLELSVLTASSAPELRWQTIVLYLLTCVLSVSLTIWSLLLGKKHLNWRSPAMSILADAAYWIYLLHLPMVLFLQTLLVPLAWPVYGKLMMVVVGTIVPCLASYFVFVRYTPVGWLLHGKRSFP